MSRWLEELVQYERDEEEVLRRLQEHAARERTKAEARLRAIWVDGPDSEAARAARGESEHNRQWLQGYQQGALSMSEPDYRAMWEESQAALDRARLLLEQAHNMMIETGACDGYTVLFEDIQSEHDDACEEPEQLEPDPTHVPAVRRVVVFDGGRGTRRKARHAYWDAALELLWRAATRWPKSVDPKRWWDYWNDTRTRRLAAALRHRDEEAGHR